MFHNTIFTYCAFVVVIFFGYSYSSILDSKIQEDNLFPKDTQSDDVAKTIITESCQDCSNVKCPSPGYCPSGMVRDQCGCCDVCGLEEGQLCNPDEIEHQPDKPWYGRCGYYLECKVRTDTDISKVQHHFTCQCMSNGPVCGTDNVTYSSFCKLNAVQVHTNGSVTSAHDGPCKSSPVFINELKNVQKLEGEQVTVTCEVEGYPVPDVRWTYKRLDQEAQNLPNDDPDISISTRGGPRSLQVTSYLQLSNLKSKHEGVYSCIASNGVGTNSKKCNVVVLPNGDMDKAREF